MTTTNLPTPEACPRCKDAYAPCTACRRRIHESWHARGWFWIRPEECHEGCPGVGGGSRFAALTDPAVAADQLGDAAVASSLNRGDM